MPVGKRDVTFEVVITLPLDSYHKVTRLHSDLPNFNQTIWELNYEMESIQLTGTHGYIEAVVSFGLVPWTVIERLWTCRGN